MNRSKSQVHGITQYIDRLEKIAEEYGEKVTKEAEKLDEFEKLKRKMYQTLEEVRDSMRDRQLTLKRQGNCHATIASGHKIRQQLDLLRTSLPKLQELHRKAQGKRNAREAARKEELKLRIEDMRNLKKCVDEAQELFTNGNVENVSGTGGGSGGNVPASSLFGSRSNACDEQRAEMNGDEEQALEEMQRKDKELDVGLDSIGKVAERLKNVANEIGTVAERHKIKAENLGDDAQKCDEDLRLLNRRMEEVRQYDKNTNFCCQLVLGLTLLCCVGFVFQQAQ